MRDANDVPPGKDDAGQLSAEEYQKLLARPVWKAANPHADLLLHLDSEVLQSDGSQ